LAYGEVARKLLATEGHVQTASNEETMGRTASAKDHLDDAVDAVLDAVPDAAGDAAGQVSDAASGAWGIASRRPGRAGLVLLLVLVGVVIGWRWSRS
jgi:hypothetical protein